ncbi:MAG: isoprenylcysteine carboxylmethyltransferase family protein [Chromatiales bacterium]|nr:isoprenylcysteine carboxylmethyltransferase family protein [Chromatiales bacterium]
MIKRSLMLTYGVASYLLFVAVFGYAILFIGNILVSPSLDSVGDGNLLHAMLIDMGLLGLFAVQHSIMARPAFKKMWTRIIPKEIERSTYVLISTVLLGATVYFWQPMGGIIWEVSSPMVQTILYGLFATGWAILFLASFQQNHYDLFGLRQVWLAFRNKPYTQLPFKTPFLYRHMRHPLYVGMLIGIWAAPTMSVAHLVFALLCTGYIFVGTLFEEKDLEELLPEYKQYKKDVPMFMPRPSRNLKHGNSVPA